MKLTRKDLIHRLDRLRQTCARYEGAKKKKGTWYNTCVTCGSVLPVSKLQGGHFCSRTCYPLRWDERNVHPQCARCNLYKSGAYIEYSQWFIKEYGQDTFDTYVNTYKQWQRGELPAYKMDELRELYDKWLKKGRELEKKVDEKIFPASWEKASDYYLRTKI